MGWVVVKFSLKFFSSFKIIKILRTASFLRENDDRGFLDVQFVLPKKKYINQKMFSRKMHFQEISL